MVKVFGGILLITACTALGVGKAWSLRRRAGVLTELVTALELMRGEICVYLTPMPQLLEMLVQETHAAQCFFRKILSGLDGLGAQSFASIWDKALGELSVLSRDELSVLSALGATLGRYDAHEQEVAISRAIAQLQTMLDLERRQLGAATKLYVGLGASLGLIFTIALV